LNIAHINQAADAYLKNAEGPDAARLTFLKGLWELQAELETSAPAFVAPEPDVARDALASGQPLFRLSSPQVPADAYRAAITRVVAYVLDSAALDPADADALRSADVAAAVSDEMAASALGDFDAFVTEVSRSLQTNPDSPVPSVATLAFVLHEALTPFLTAASAASLKAVDGINWEIWGTSQCPVCGAAAALGRMSEGTSLQGAGRTLWCSQCHAEWGYERIRCARFGSRTQNLLRYTYEESDPAHRLHLCDTCHGYLKVTFESDVNKRIEMVVEEAVSLPLDAIARANGYTPSGTGA